MTGDSVRKESASTGRRKWTRLSDADRAAVVTRYEAGETSTALASEYGVAKSTILGILRANAVVVRRQPLTPEQVSEAARLYGSGLSLSQVATQLDVNQETTRVAILGAGVTLRPPTTAKSE
ncbi:helix-turn-helix domain-containing protein [Microbacterium sp. ZOR0019]|uniref:helix-turn-helix domain-containing protein n=1 Tax=Microbacterium sp. ZOR0019 TaxID=1339233 RepID=UPI003FA5F7DC